MGGPVHGRRESKFRKTKKKKTRRKDHKKMNNKFHRDKIMGKEEKNRKNS